MCNQEYGYLAEQEFIKILNQNGIPYTHVNSWFDFEIYKTQVEVKSTQISHKFSTQTKTQSYKIGRFLFTEEQRKYSLWSALFFRYDDSFLFVGFIKLNPNTPKYISIHKLREYKIYKLHEFIREVKQ